MKQRILILLVFALVALLLVGLNLASYTQKPKETDSELNPNRSSYHPGATGTLAFYSLLNETGRKVTRWQEPLDGLLGNGKQKPSVFIVIGSLRRDLSEMDESHLLAWVSNGGKLIVIDRYPADALLESPTNWKLSVSSQGSASMAVVDPADSVAMTKGVVAARPVQPTLLTAGINAIQPSVFASGIATRRLDDSEPNRKRIVTASPPPVDSYEADEGSKDQDEITDQTETPDAPVTHFKSGVQNIVVDVKYGSGKIVFVSDPFIVSNGGVGLVDNAAFAVNLTNSTGIIAFDEYHQGYGANQNRLFQFFAGTPIVAIFAQCVLLVGLVLYSRSRRFARPIPDADEDRLSKLEYVRAMAELQQRTKAFDLAIENIYREFKMRSTRLLGLNMQTASVSDLAAAIAERTSEDRDEIEQVLDSCEQIMFGESTNKHEVVDLITKLREIERKLGIRRRSQIL